VLALFLSSRVLRDIWWVFCRLYSTFWVDLWSVSGKKWIHWASVVNLDRLLYFAVIFTIHFLQMCCMTVQHHLFGSGLKYVLYTELCWWGAWLMVAVFCLCVRVSSIIATVSCCFQLMIEFELRFFTIKTVMLKKQTVKHTQDLRTMYILAWTKNEIAISSPASYATSDMRWDSQQCDNRACGRI